MARQATPQGAQDFGSDSHWNVDARPSDVSTTYPLLAALDDERADV